IVSAKIQPPAKLVQPSAEPPSLAAAVGHRRPDMTELRALMALLAMAGSPVAAAATDTETSDPSASSSQSPEVEQAQQSTPTPAEDHHILETRVEAPAPTSAASAEIIGERDLQVRPPATPQAIIKVVPGLVSAQHQGGGKAAQLFLRGFDADHGTDVALSIDGVPINMPSHGHGQGYGDLNFLVPEAIDQIDVTKG